MIVEQKEIFCSENQARCDAPLNVFRLYIQYWDRISCPHWIQSSFVLGKLYRRWEWSLTMGQTTYSGPAQLGKVN